MCQLFINYCIISLSILDKSNFLAYNQYITFCIGHIYRNKENENQFNNVYYFSNFTLWSYYTNILLFILSMILSLYSNFIIILTPMCQFFIVKCLITFFMVLEPISTILPTSAKWSKSPCADCQLVSRMQCFYL